MVEHVWEDDSSSSGTDEFMVLENSTNGGMSEAEEQSVSMVEPIDGETPPLLLEQLRYTLNESLKLLEKEMGIDDAPWTENDTEMHLATLQQFAQQITAVLERTPPSDMEAATCICQSMQLRIENGRLESSSVKTLRTSVDILLREIRPLDLNKLSSHLRANQYAAGQIRDKDIILLIGPSGSGKTTTLLYLAGAKFEEVELDAYDHSEPVSLPSPNLETFRTLPGSKSVTRSVQTVPMRVGDRTVLLCDTPGFGDSDGAEMEIANCFSLLQAIQGASTVKPVLVMSRDGMGDRFQGLGETLTTVSRMLNGRNNLDMSCFCYLFTKFGGKDSKRIHKRLVKFREDLMERSDSSPLFLSLVDDMIAKTASRSLVFCTTEDDDAEGTLEALYEQSSACIADPKTAFTPFLPQAVSTQLQLQLDLSLTVIETAVACQDFESTAVRIEQLRELAVMLPDAVEMWNVRSASVSTLWWKVDTWWRVWCRCSRRMLTFQKLYQV